MKKLRLLLFGLTVTALITTSCSNDDNGTSDNQSVAGTYSLTAVNTQTATDFNQDGMPHENQMQESDCYAGGMITLHNDNTFTYTLTGIQVNEQAGTAGCMDAVTVTGSWEVYSGSGSTYILDATYQDAGGSNVDLVFNIEGNELSVFNVYTPYADRDANGNPYYVTGSVEYIFTK